MAGEHIDFHCHCGARVRLPVSAAGKRARCKTCAAIFTVPLRSEQDADAPIPLEPVGGSAAGPAHEIDADWLKEFAQGESLARGSGRKNVIDEMGPALLPTDEVDKAFAAENSARHEPDWIVPPTRSFWLDVAMSFVFIANPNSLVTFGVLVLVTSLLGALSSLAGILGLIAAVLINGYLCAFYMATIREAAAGEEDLPAVAVSNLVDDLVWPLVEFIGATVVSLAPYFVVVLVTLIFGVFLPDRLYIVLPYACLLFWPVVVLALSIGGGFSGLWPHLVVKTVLAAAPAYLLVCGVVAVAGLGGAPPATSARVLIWLFELLLSATRGVVPSALPPDPLSQWLSRLAGASPAFKVAVGLHILEVLISLYAAIVSMRVIGLYYCHYKRRFPWAAE